MYNRNVLLVISAWYLHGLAAYEQGLRKDYHALVHALDAQVLDLQAVEACWSGRLLRRFFGAAVAQAWMAFRRRHEFAAIVTDGEHIGIPLALLLKLTGSKIPHVTIGHRLSADKKRPFFRWLKVHTHITRIALHAQRQHDLAVHELGIPPEQLVVTPYQVDTQFWQPQPTSEERMVCSAGLEFRDYPTLFKAVEGLDARVIVGAASNWSRRRNTASGASVPSNVHVAAFDYVALREVYARSAAVVVPLDDIDFQAGVTTILEAMAMAKPVIVTHSRGQTDVVEDRRTITRGAHPRSRPLSLIRLEADHEGFEIEPNGFYVPPNDPEALRRAIAYLLDHPEERARLGQAGRRAVEHFMDVEHFAARIRQIVDSARATVDAYAKQPSSYAA